SADHAGVFKMKFLVPPFGPEHEGRVAVGSPRHRYWAVGKLVLNQPVLRQDSRRIGLCDFSIAYTDQATTVAHEGRLVSSYELRIFYCLIWQARLRLKCESRAGGYQHKEREFEGRWAFHAGHSN